VFGYQLVLRFTSRHNCLAGISPHGELTIISHFSRARGRLCFSTYATDMKECDAPELNNTTAKVSLMKHIPMIVSTWLTLPWA
jgi:hypothetical protein